MGNESSTLAGDDAVPPRQPHRRHGAEDGDEDVLEGGECCGFRVLGIQEQSPAAAVGFVSFFDFILEANGIRLDTRDATLMELIAQSEDRPMRLQVYNVKAQASRELQLTPSRKWPGKGLLGVTIRFDSYEGAEDQLLHVLNVEQSSPAERAGLRAGSDYLLGTPERVFADADDLHDEILDALDGSFQCYVYKYAVASSLKRTRQVEASVEASIGQDEEEVVERPAAVEPQEQPPTEAGEANSPAKIQQPEQQQDGQAPEAGATTEAVTTATPAAKPRYTARMDHQFPISTVAVLADP
ncbi:hypothetical protein BBJ28_00025411 [Nothophytophthora sp. Chile5]|nr:hypothetical protein BBJ28_00025411 [Nothophytophthora sp. Chile5]